MTTAEAPEIDAATTRFHLISTVAAGVSVAKIAALTGISRADISSLMAEDRLGRPRRRTIAQSAAEQLMLVRADLSDAAPDDRVIAKGATRRLQALIVAGWTVADIARWLDTSEEWVEVVLTGRTRTLTVRAHQRVAAMFTTRWMRPPTSKNPDSVARARREGYKSALAWDDIDFDLAPAAGSDRRGATDDTLIDETAVTMSVRGEKVRLSTAERRLVVSALHAKGMTDNGMSEHTGVPLTTIWNTRTALGLEPNGDFARAERGHGEAAIAA